MKSWYCDLVSNSSKFNTDSNFKSSGAKGWEDRSYGNTPENDDFENGRSRRKRGGSSDLESDNADK